jgi:hypothetical protein
MKRECGPHFPGSSANTTTVASSATAPRSSETPPETVVERPPLSVRDLDIPASCRLELVAVGILAVIVVALCVVEVARPPDPAVDDRRAADRVALHRPGGSP